MEVKFADSFGKSLKRLIMHKTWWYKTYEFFRYDIPRFIRNVWAFREVLWNHRWWDYHFTLEALRTSLEIMEKGMHGGLEIKESRDKKIKKMQRAIQILNNIEEDNYIDLAEAALGKELIMRSLEFEEIEGETMDNPMGEKGEKLYQLVDKDTPEERENNRQIFDLSHKLAEDEWSELWQIFKGQDTKQFSKEEDWDKQFDGSGMQGWWD